MTRYAKPLPRTLTQWRHDQVVAKYWCDIMREMLAKRPAAPAPKQSELFPNPYARRQQ